RPVLASVGAFPEAAARPAAVEAAAAATPLIARRVDRAGVRRIERDIGKAGVVVDELDLVPGLAAVGRLVDAAVRAGPEQMSGRGDVHGLRIFRIDHDARDRLRLRETELRERLAAVDGLVDPVAE